MLRLRRALHNWDPVSNRILRARFQHKHGKLSVCVAYAPTEATEDEAKDAFYTKLQGVLEAVKDLQVNKVYTCTIANCFNAISEDEMVNHEVLKGATQEAMNVAIGPVI